MREGREQGAPLIIKISASQNGIRNADWLLFNLAKTLFPFAHTLIKTNVEMADGDDHVREACKNFPLNLKFTLENNARESEHCSKAEMSLLFC